MSCKDRTTGAQATTTARCRPRGRAQPFARWRAAADELIAEIVVTAERIAEARDGRGRRVARVERLSRALVAVERSRYCLAIADLARVLGIRKQSAHELAHAAARVGYLALEPNPDDRRLLQLFLTPRGRAALARGRSIERIWLDSLLNGLAERDVGLVTHVLRVLRQRLERGARERARHARAAKPGGPWPGRGR
jgi:DNA-binding MarR family transcriptional regulator